LNKAYNIGSDLTAVLGGEIENITLFINAFDDMTNQRWLEAINNLNDLLRADDTYDNGFPKYLLYEAHIARGDIFSTYGENTNAQEEYEAAAIIAYGETGNKIMLFETLVKSARVLQRIGSVPESADYYYRAMQTVNFSDKIIDNPELTSTLNQADNAFFTNNFFTATDLYETVLEEANLIFEVETLPVVRGDSLLHIAFDYGTTLNAISGFNQLGDNLIIRTSTELLIPVLSEDQQQ